MYAKEYRAFKLILILLGNSGKFCQLPYFAENVLRVYRLYIIYNISSAHMLCSPLYHMHAAAKHTVVPGIYLTWKISHLEKVGRAVNQQLPDSLLHFHTLTDTTRSVFCCRSPTWKLTPAVVWVDSLEECLPQSFTFESWANESRLDRQLAEPLLRKVT